MVDGILAKFWHVSLAEHPYSGPFYNGRRVGSELRIISLKFPCSWSDLYAELGVYGIDVLDVVR